MKKCSRCKQEKSYDGFYKDSRERDGFNRTCKACRLQMDRQRRQNDPGWVTKRKLQNRQFHLENREQIARRKKEWLASEAGKKSHRASSRKWKMANSKKVRAHRAVERAIKRGELIPKEKCEACHGTTRVEAHHPDYRKKLTVIWLCKNCHEKLT